METIETQVQCPFCFEMIPIVVDPSEEHQSYIEDCSVCCRPIRFEVVCSQEGELVSIEAIRD
jgi:hypothetical protein